MKSEPLRVVVADANVLINMMHIEKLDLCARLPGLELVVPDHVREEINRPEQLSMLDGAVTRGLFRLVSITEKEDIDLFVELRTRLGRGETACIVLAIGHSWAVASDERGRFRQEVMRRIGADRIIGTADLFIRAIEAGLLSIQEADSDKALLEKRRFRMPFGSFKDVMGSVRR